MDPVRQLIELEAIKRLKARYFRFLDTKDWANWIHVFAEDAAMTFGDPPTTVSGREAIVAYVSKLFNPGLSVHHGYMPEIDLLSDTEAKGIWAMEDYVQLPERGVHGLGHYHETYRKGADGEWRIATTQLTRLRVTGLPVTN